ncbi:bacteriohemerythrin [Helicobacter burdigaliensis]|uniref:bacteriohemerythrin n=1 Tax=Helicobacter burdigaliensis TaxID=2315334 RepID=UPI000EF6E614|nr:hemerythrin family protein [Helicobacter burdigaliensis]
MIQWSDSYSVHNARIDKQHQKLFDMATRAYNMAHKQITPNEMKEILMEFFEYIKEHFRDEEIYMQAIDYPDLEQHKRIHTEITKTMISLIKDIKTLNEMKEKLQVIAKNWLLEHILKEDMKYERYRRSLLIASMPESGDHFSKVVENEMHTKEYHYFCSCPNKIHDVPYDVHQKILNGAKFRCKQCKQEIIYLKR